MEINKYKDLYLKKIDKTSNKLNKQIKFYNKIFLQTGGLVSSTVETAETALSQLKQAIEIKETETDGMFTKLTDKIKVLEEMEINLNEKIKVLENTNNTSISSDKKTVEIIKTLEKEVKKPSKFKSAVDAVVSVSKLNTVVDAAAGASKSSNAGASKSSNAGASKSLKSSTGAGSNNKG
jgi:primosomal protein N''